MHTRAHPRESRTRPTRLACRGRRHGAVGSNSDEEMSDEMHVGESTAVSSLGTRCSSLRTCERASSSLHGRFRRGQGSPRCLARGAAIPRARDAPGSRCPRETLRRGLSGCAQNLLCRLAARAHERLARRGDRPAAEAARISTRARGRSQCDRSGAGSRPQRRAPSTVADTIRTGSKLRTTSERFLSSPRGTSCSTSITFLPDSSTSARPAVRLRTRRSS